MKLHLINGKDLNGKVGIIGWNFEAENEQEEKDLSVVRNAIFFGLNETYPKYAGRQDDPDTQLVKRIWYRIPQFVTNMRLGTITCDDEEAKKFFNTFD